MTVIIVSVLLLVIGGFIAFAIYLQFKEQARLEKLRKIVALKNQLRQIRRYLDDIPPQYQPKDMRLWLFSRLLTHYDELIKLQPDATLSRRRKLTAEEMSELQTSKQKRRAKPINDELMVMDLKRLFDSFQLCIKQAEKEKTLDTEVVARYSNLLQFYKYKAKADLHAYIARQSFLSGNYEKAIASYKEALTQLAPIKGTAEAKTASKQLTSLINEVEEAQSGGGNDNGASSHAEQDSADSELTQEWDKFIDETEFKKKKHF
ncbi:hypothetical protein [Marinomonas pollencensis]|uniref:Uncharacterized protein n=1 Tax=Marinomonas pollencensis TaxID=491954 RepID=A0A3E0DW88_9GAMM|nr:hypothetical protein [Marinomonas pollencensis]REG86774.1 hypothetical protein DFP81_101342 [Marinomonas pollencensis]